MLVPLKFSHLLDYFIRVEFNRRRDRRADGITSILIDRKSAMSIHNYWGGVDRAVRWEEAIPVRSTKKIKRGRKGVWEQNGEALRDRNRPTGRRFGSSHTEIHLKSSHYLNYWSF